MTQLLVLERGGARLAVEAGLIERVEDLEAPGAPVSTAPRLLGLLELELEVAESGAGRLLNLRGGLSVRVPSRMDLVAGVEILALPGLLEPWAGAVGITGLADLEDGPALICDPRVLIGDAQSEASS